MRIGIAITRASAVEPTWTTAHLACALLAEGHSVRVLEPWDFEIDPAGRALARAHAFDAPCGSRADFCQALARREARRCYVELSALDALLLRMNPLDPAVLSFALDAVDRGVPVLNDPTTLLRTSHKGFVASLDGVDRPATVLSRSRATLVAFAERQPEGVVVKPARASGGRGVAWIRPNREKDLDQAIRQAQQQGDGYVVVQEYLPAADQGEKRLIWLAGELLGGYLRTRAPGEFRHNLKQGATPGPCDITDQDRVLAERLGPHLRRHGVWLAGLDVIGDRLVEVNTLNPGGLHLAQEFGGGKLAPALVDSLLDRIGEPRPRSDGAASRKGPATDAKSSTSKTG